MAKFVFSPRRSGNWDKTSLVLYASVYGSSDQFSKRLKVRMAQWMLAKHREIDRTCDPVAAQDGPLPEELAYP